MGALAVEPVYNAKEAPMSRNSTMKKGGRLPAPSGAVGCVGRNGSCCKVMQAGKGNRLLLDGHFAWPSGSSPVASGANNNVG